MHAIRIHAQGVPPRRKRLPLALFKELLEHVCDAVFPEVHATGRPLVLLLSILSLYILGYIDLKS